jgi:competence protein ComEA
MTLRRYIRSLAVLLAFSILSTMTLAQGGGASGSPDAAGKKQASAESGAKTKKSDLVDINAASKEELTALPGIGDAYSQKIIDGRPYHSKRDLLTRKIIPQATYDKVQDKIIAHRVAGAGSKTGKKGSAK